MKKIQQILELENTVSEKFKKISKSHLTMHYEEAETWRIQRQKLHEGSKRKKNENQWRKTLSILGHSEKK